MVARQTQTIIDDWLLFFAPSHNLLATETAVGTHNDPCFETTFSHRCNDLLKGIDCAAGRVALTGAKLGAKAVPNRQRQTAAGNSSSHKSRERNVLPDGRAGGRRWYPDR